MTNKPNILVLGATGKVGGEVVKQLQDNPDVNVVAATRFTIEAHPPKEFLNNARQEGVEGIYANAYLNCVFTQFELNVADKIPEADRTFDNFEAIVGRKPNTWQDFALHYRQKLLY